MTTRISAANIQPGAITADRLADGVGGGPKITNVQVTDSGYNVLDDTAVSLSGGYLRITGTGFQSGCVAIVGNTPAAATSFVSSSFLNVQVGAADAGTYILYVVNPDGGVAIRVNAVTYSQIPVWITGSTLPEIFVDDQISIQLSAAGDSPVAYRLLAEFTLPPGLSLSSSGLLTGSVTGLENDTLYSFTVIAEDTENQDSPRTFSITVIPGDPFFNSTVLLLNGDGANGADNGTIIDSSSFSRTTSGIDGVIPQGSFSPFSQDEGKWSVYFDGNGDHVAVDQGSVALENWYSEDYSIEMWVYPAVHSQSGVNGSGLYISHGVYNSNTTHWAFGTSNTGYLRWYYFNGGPVALTATTGQLPLNSWSHVALVYTHSTGAIKGYVNGVEVFSGTKAGTPSLNTNDKLNIGVAQGYYYKGYISNLRVVKGTAVYTTAFTPSTSPLTAITNTSLLTCQSNRFKDNSVNNLTMTTYGDVAVKTLVPFKPSTVYSISKGGSSYFGGGNNRHYYSVSADFNLGDTYTMETWVYLYSYPATGQRVRVLMMAENTATNGLAYEIDPNGLFGVVSPSPLGKVTGFVPGQTVKRNSWNHLAVVRQPGSGRSYINGVLIEDFATPAIQSSGNVNFKVGYDVVNTVNGRIHGYLTGVRVVKGVALYSGNSFSLPTSLPGVVSGTSILLNYTNAGIADLTGRNILRTVNGAQVSTAQKKYGTGSMFFDGSNDFITSPSDSNYDLPGDFTIECWIRIPNVTDTVYYRIASRGAYQSGTNDWIFVCRPSERLVTFQWGNPNTTVGAINVLFANTWHHIAVSRQGSTLRIFVDGVIRAVATTSNNFTNTQPFAIGTNSSSLGDYFKGYIDDFRITKNIARYTANFTPPESAHRLK